MSDLILLLFPQSSTILVTTELCKLSWDEIVCSLLKDVHILCYQPSRHLSVCDYQNLYSALSRRYISWVQLQSVQVGFTLSYAKKDLKECRGTTLLYF